jgi:hypothetical protein
MTEPIFESYKGLQIRPICKTALIDYSQLLSASFQKFYPSLSYLNWLYYENPRGSVCGYDAFDGDVLVAHYACIPIKIDGYKFNSLLSLNTATHPNYQGRGLFKVLATKTFEIASSTFANVIGVANSKSVGGFVKHLGFDAIGNLELRFGNLSRPSAGSRIYSKEELSWRIRCPGRPLRDLSLNGDSHLLSTKPFRLLPSLKSVVFEEEQSTDSAKATEVGLTLDWRRGTKPLLKLPSRFKPSPLVLIYKPLLESDSMTLSSLSFPDFDAF